MKFEVKSNLILETTGHLRLQLWVSSIENSGDARVFVYKTKRVVPYASTKDNFFTNIASRSDMEEYPAEEPKLGSPFFRKRILDVLIESPKVMQDTIESIKHELGLLAKTYEVIT